MKNFSREEIDKIMIREVTQDNLYLLLPSKVSWLATMLAEDKKISILEAIKQIINQIYIKNYKTKALKSGI